jgi:hypothetical protein
MTYDQLYNNMVKKFTVEKDNTDYTLGDYMLMKAKSKKNSITAVTTAEVSNLPVARENKETAITTIFTYVNEKLKVKEAPVRDKTIRTFPLRTSLTSFCSALVVCALVVCCSFFAFRASVLNDATVVVEAVEDYTEEANEQILL